MTSVLYSIAMRTIKDQPHGSIKEAEVLGELQKGFKQGRRLDDNLFEVAQCIETAASEEWPLWMAFLEITEAYDIVNHFLLWKILEKGSVGSETTCLLKKVYEENSVAVNWKEMEGAPRVTVTCGLRQGCLIAASIHGLHQGN